MDHPAARPPAASIDTLAAAELAGLEPVVTLRRRWPMLLGAALSLAMAVGLGIELWRSGLAGLSRTVPASPWFYAAFALLYMTPPAFDYLIFRRLWGIPLDGLVALIKKRIANEVLFGYSGDAYFYTWARGRATSIAAPFGAVKDVTILSALAGNGMTLLLMALSLPLAFRLLPPDQLPLLLASAAVTVAMTLPFLFFSRRVFSLSRPILWWIFAVHCARLAAGSLLIALAWHFALPDVPVGTWLLLAAGRLLVSRLPLVPNKDLLFASFAVLAIGRDADLTALMAFTAALFLLCHAGFIVVLAAVRLIRRRLPA